MRQLRWARHLTGENVLRRRRLPDYCTIIRQITEMGIHNIERCPAPFGSRHQLRWHRMLGVNSESEPGLRFSLACLLPSQ